MLLNLVSPINNLGYGTVGYNILKSLTKRGHSVGYWPIGAPSFDGDEEAHKIIKAARAKTEMYNCSAPSLRIWHQHEMDMFPGRGKRIGFPIFELNKFNDREKHHLSNLDTIFVASKWAQKVIKENGIDVPTFVVPFGVDTSVFFEDPMEKSTSYYSKNKTIFLNIGKWEIRKGHRELLQAFCKAFKPEDNVELWMINHNPFIGPENEHWKSAYIESSMGSNIRIFPRISTQAELRRLFNQVDFGVFPAHAEGWNLEILEMMACGAHIIATDYSGHTEFLNSDNAMLLKPTGMEPAVDGKWFFGQGEWCTFSVDELADLMKAAHQSKQKGLGPNKAGMKTAEQFSWENTARVIESIL